MTRPIPKAELKAAEAELKKVRKAWKERQGVTAFDIGYKFKEGKMTEELAIRVHVRRKLPFEAVPESERFPETLGGFAVDVIEAEYGPQLVE